MVLFLFFCSGATALIYEVLWSKYLSLIFGSTVQAQTVVLAVFMGGLALGNRWLGKRADVLSNPLLAYGYIEMAIGVYAFAFEWLYRAADDVFGLAGPPLLEHSVLLLMLKTALSVALLLTPTVLMGGTLPLLAAWLQRRETEAGRLSARFYSINSLGAVFGAGLAGFYLVKAAGMVSTAQMSALVNALIGATAIGIARRQGPTLSTASCQSRAEEVKPTSSLLLRWGTGLVATTGGISMGLEVLASRAMALIFGSSLQSFAVVLMAFILGIGLGSAAIASRRLRALASERVVTVLLLAAAAWLGLLVFKIESWVDLYRWAKTGLAAGEVGYLYYLVLTGAIALVILGIPAALIGAVLPLMMRAVSASGTALGSLIGRLLTWNTLGAVGGVMLTGFGLMPHCGLRTSFGLLTMTLALAALINAAIKNQRRLTVLSTAVAALLATLLLQGGEGWKVVFSSGAFRSREAVFDPTAMEQRRKYVEIIFYEDGPDATVTVVRFRPTKELFLRVNGKTDASSRGDLSTQYLLAHLPLLARPGAKDVFLLGLGSGITGAAALAHPVERLTIAENCEPVVKAAKIFEAHNEGVLTNARTRIFKEDGRTVLKLSSQKYDVIISEPSNPWTVGVGNVFSREYYELAASHLTEGGLMAQWFQVYEMHDGIVAMVIRTFASVYPYFEIWDTCSGDLVLLGSHQLWTNNLAIYREAFQREPVRRQLESIGLRTPESLWARQLASQRTAFAIADEGAIQSDLFPVLEYEAPKAFYLGIFSAMLKAFDERTTQTPLLDESKRTALSSLNDHSLKSIFEPYSTINLDLRTLLTWRLSTNNSPAQIPPSVAMVPSIFRPANAPVRALEAPQDAGEELEQLLEASHRLQTNSAATQQSIQQIETILASLRAQAAPKINGWSPSYFAVLAARHSLGQGDYASAKRLIELGQRIGPVDKQLDYLSRILEREHPAVGHVLSARN